MDSDPQLIVRRVMPVDLRGTAELLATQLRARGRQADPERVRDAAQEALENSSVLVMGAYHEGQPGFAHGKMVGVLIMNLLQSIEHLGLIGWVETLYVRDSYRRKGLAQRMLDETIHWGEARGLRRIEIEFTDEHEAEAASQLYLKNHFELIRRIRFTRSIQGA
jgi:GNAT superfamily N-acetyltransferase